MVLFIERQAVLSVLSLSRDPIGDEEYVVVPKDLKPPTIEKLSEEDDEVSLASTECSSVASSCSSPAPQEKSVSFSLHHNQVHTVERLYPKDELSSFFYSCEDTARFRQEYRLERKVLADLDVDDPSSHEEELSGLFCASAEPGFNISRVVVLHNNVIETYPSSEQDFFDNDSFWSGSITWY